MSMLLIEVAKQLRISPYNVTYPIKINVYKHLAYALFISVTIFYEILLLVISNMLKALTLAWLSYS